MRFPKPPAYKDWGFVISMPFITLAMSYILYGERMFREWYLWLTVIPVLYGLGYLSYRAHHIYEHTIHVRYPSLRQTSRRVVLLLLVNVFVMTPSIVIIILFFHAFSIYGYTWDLYDFWYAYLVGLGVNIVFEALWEVMYIIEKMKEAAADKEMIRQMQMHQEFENLKQKVNPHFLFNCFNTLSSLISEDPDKAEIFLDELSKVYRYLLRSNESGMSTIEQERKFILSYAQLLHTRYGEGFKLEMEIDNALLERQIPSLSLQLLVENAVKHNVISKQHQIVVEISSLGNAYLVVRNNLNKKTRFNAESTGIGLTNIREKYRLLNRTDVRVEETPDRFEVAIPVL